MSDKPRRDIWEKLDVIGKLTSGVFLALIALFVKIGGDQIAASMQTAELVQSLIGDLTTRSEQTRQDIALIALNNAIGERDSRLVSEIAERLFLDLKTSDATGSVAFAVLKERNPQRAGELLARLTPDTLGRKELRTDPDVSKYSRETVTPQAQLLSRAYSTVVYIQFRGETGRPLAEGLRSLLKEKGYYAPGVERVDKKFPNNIRYFHPEDQLNAQAVREVVERYLKEQGHSLSLQVQNFSQGSYKVPNGHLEIWLNL